MRTTRFNFSVFIALVGLCTTTLGIRVSSSRKGGQVARDQAKPTYKGWAKGKQFICFNKWRKRGEQGTADYCLVNLQEIFEARENVKSKLYHMYVSGRWSDCQAKTRNYAMKLCSLKGKRDVRVSYSSRLHVPKACLAMSGKFQLPKTAKSITIFQAVRTGRECNSIFTTKFAGRGKFAKLPTPSPTPVPTFPVPSYPTPFPTRKAYDLQDKGDFEDEISNSDEDVPVQKSLTDFSSKLAGIVLRLKAAKAAGEGLDDGGAETAADDLHDAAKVGQEIIEAFETDPEFSDIADEIKRIIVGLEVMAKIADKNGKVDVVELDHVIKILSDAEEEAAGILRRFHDFSENEENPVASMHDAAAVGQEVAEALEILPENREDAETVTEITKIVKEMADAEVVDKETVEEAITAILGVVENLGEDSSGLALKLSHMLSKLKAANGDDHEALAENTAAIALNYAANVVDEVAESFDAEDAEEFGEITKVLKDMGNGGKVAPEKLDEAIALTNSMTEKLKEESSNLAAKLAEVLSALEFMKIADQDLSAAAVIMDLKDIVKSGVEVAEVLEKDPGHSENAESVREIVKVVDDMASVGKLNTKKIEEAIAAIKVEIEKLNGDLSDLVAKMSEMISALEAFKAADQQRIVVDPKSAAEDLEIAAKIGDDVVEALEKDPSAAAVDGEQVKEVIKVVEVMANDGKADLAKLEAAIANASAENQKLKDKNGILSTKLMELLAQLEAAKDKVDAGFAWMHHGGREIAEGWEDELDKTSDAVNDVGEDEDLSTEFGNKAPVELDEDEEVDLEEQESTPEAQKKYSHLNKGEMTWDNVFDFWRQMEARTIAQKKEEARLQAWRERARARARARRK